MLESTPLSPTLGGSVIQTKKLAEILASPKKNENNYAYSPRNQKAGRNFG